MKASTLNKVSERLDKSHFSLDVIMRLAPFLSTETLDELVLLAVEDNMQLDVISGIAPFLSEDSLAKLVDKAIGGTFDIREVVKLAPFPGATK